MQSSEQLETVNEGHKDYLRIAKSIAFLIDQQHAQPSLHDLAQHIGISEGHLQRTFKAWAGISPKQFLQFITLTHAKKKLQQHSVLSAAHSAGLSGSSRLHDLFINVECVTPGEFKNAGHGLSIIYGIHSSPLGYCLLALSPRGLCHLAFFDTPQEQQMLINEFHQQWHHADIREDSSKTAAVCSQIFSSTHDRPSDIKLLLQGTHFQMQVWQALLAIPYGNVCSYQDIANAMDKPSAVRAVASAIAKNNIAYLIPCHRVIRNSGVINHYRWGANRKMALLAREEGLSPQQNPITP